MALLREMLAECGENCYVEPPLRANWGGRNVHFGDGVYANFNLTCVDDADIYVGSHTMIGPNVTICTAAHPLAPALRAKGLQYNRPVRIGENVWIGACVTILPGVTIGDGSVIGAGSLVLRDVPRSARSGPTTNKNHEKARLLRHQALRPRIVRPREPRPLRHPLFRDAPHGGGAPARRRLRRRLRLRQRRDRPRGRGRPRRPRHPGAGPALRRLQQRGFPGRLRGSPSSESRPTRPTPSRSTPPRCCSPSTATSTAPPPGRATSTSRSPDSPASTCTARRPASSARARSAASLPISAGASG